MKGNEIQKTLKELKILAERNKIDISEDIVNLEEKLASGSGTAPYAWKRVELARHPKRPTSLEYINLIFSDFFELHGDRGFGDDAAIIGGLAFFEQRAVTIIAHQKGRNMKDNIKRNYGMPLPEGYRKALRLAKQAEKFGRPVISFIDTPGAYPGISSEERGIGEAIARNLKEFSVLKVPVICVVIGEGGSGGALGIGVGNHVHMLENSIYSVITPEGFASILLRDSAKAKVAADLMKLTAQDLFGFGIVDSIIPEPAGGAHLDVDYTAAKIKRRIADSLAVLAGKSGDQLSKERLLKFSRMGSYYERQTKKQGALRKLLGIQRPTP